jgi:diguanylate cyclase (GGDEF)-like protein/PAS domain S-box-containing protein
MIHRDLFGPLTQATGEAVWELHPSGRLRWYDSPYLASLGLDGMFRVDHLSAWVERLHPDDAPRVRARQAAGWGRPGACWADEYRLRRDDGAYATVVARGSVIRDGNGTSTVMVGTIRDVTAERDAARHLKEAMEYADALFESLPGPAYHVDSELQMVRWNSAFSEVTGYSDEELAQLRVPDFFVPHERAKVIATVEEVFAVGFGQVCADFVRRDGTRLPYLFTGQRFAHAGRLGYVGIALSMAEQVELQERLRHEATHDVLTGLANRTLLYEKIDAAIEASDTAGHLVALLDLDLDRFKIVNDGFGHPYGDLVLQAVAERLGRLVCEEDTVVRMGGDEFVILTPLVLDTHDIHEMAQRLVDSFAEPFLVEGRLIHLTGSIGVSFYPQDGRSGPELIDAADMAMYYAKAAGRSAYRLFEPVMAQDAQRRNDMERQLRQAAPRGQLWLAFQPKFDLASGAITGCEALLRWNHPEHGSISPADFIPVAEESGLILPIGEWVLETACRQGRAWLDAGLPELTIAVNISAAQLFQRDPVGWVTATLERTGFPATLLELELTESQLAQDVETAIDIVRRLRGLGIRVAIDDFGTGYSSLEYLRRFDVTSLKIDRSFVDGMLSEAGDAAIVRATVALAHAFGLSAIAEGVETEEQRQFLRELHCHAIQGYLVGKPIPAEEFTSLLQDC